MIFQVDFDRKIVNAKSRLIIHENIIVTFVFALDSHYQRTGFWIWEEIALWQKFSHWRAKTTNDNLAECHFLTKQFLLIVATVCSTCLNTASAIRYTLHQLFFVCTRVERTSIARILTFHLSFVCWVILNWCSKNVKLDILIRSFWSFPIILRVKNPMSDNPDIFTSGD